MAGPSGVNAAVAAGTAYIAGNLVTYVGETFRFPFYKDTYRDLLPNGTMVFVSVANTGQPPAVTATALRIGVTITNGSDTTADAILAASENLYNSNFDIQA